MRKKTSNKKVLQAITIGLSAMMAITAVPMEAFAAEGTTENPTETPEPVVDQNTQPTTTADAAQTATNTASDALTAKDTNGNDVIKATNEAAKAVVDAKLESTDTKLDSNGNSYADNLTNAAKDITGVDGSGITNPDSVISGTEGISDDLEQAEYFEGAADAKIAGAETSAKEMSDNTSDLKDTTDDALTNMQTGTSAIENATSIAGANSAYAALETLATNTESSFNTAVSSYDTLMQQYQAQLAAVSELEAAYNSEIAAAKTGAGQVASELKDAKEKADALKKAADDAYANLNQHVQNMLKINDLIVENETDFELVDKDKDGKHDEGAPEKPYNNYRGENGLRDLFRAVMAYYYLPTVGIDGVDSTKLQGISVDDIHVLNDSDTSGKTTCHYVTIDGVNYYFNYKLEQGTGSDLVIYKLRDIEVKKLKGETIAYNEFDTYTDGDKKLTKDQIKEATEAENSDDKDYYNTGSSYVKKGAVDTESSTEMKQVGDVIDTTPTETGEATQTCVSELGDVESVTYEYDEVNQQIVKTVTQGATTVKYVQKTLTVSTTVEASTENADASISDEDLQSQLQNKFAAQTTGKTIKEGATEYGVASSTENREYTVTGTYKPVFSGSVTVSKRYYAIKGYTNAPCWPWEFDDDNEKAKNEFTNGDYRTLFDQKLIDKNQTYYNGINPHDLDHGYDNEVGDGELGWYHEYSYIVDYNYTDNSLAAQTVTGIGSTEAAARDAYQTNMTNASYNSMVEKKDVTSKEAASASSVLKSKTYSATATYWELLETSDTTFTAITKYATSELVGSVILNKVYEDYKSNNNTYDSSLLSISANRTAKDSNGEKININRGMSAKIDDAVALKDKYDALQKQAEAAASKYTAAQTSVENMVTEIGKLNSRETSFFSIEMSELSQMPLPELITYLTNLIDEYSEESEVEELNRTEILASLNNLLSAARNLSAIQEQLGTAELALSNAITRLTPPATGGAPTGGETTTEAGVVPVVSAAPQAEGEVLGVNRDTTNKSTKKKKTVKKAELIEELEDATGAEDLTDDEKQEIVKELTDDTVDEDEVVAIDEPDVALADGISKKTVGWWWWLIILAFGAAGIEAYRRHQKKKANAEVQSDDK